MTEHTATEYECMMIGCQFVGTRSECIEHQAANPGHDDFWSVPSWDELAGTHVEGSS